VAGRARRRHFFFAAPPGASGRRIRAGVSGALDILADGFLVIPPSRHVAGQHYRWIVPPEGPLPPAPQWALDLLRSQKRAQPVTLPTNVTPVCVDMIPVSDRIRQLIREGPAAEPGRYRSRSEGLFACLLSLVSLGCSDETIAGIVMNPANAIAQKPLEHGPAWLATEIARARSKAAQYQNANPGSPCRTGRRTLRIEVD
jgi:hypothetical protein